MLMGAADGPTSAPVASGIDPVSGWPVAPWALAAGMAPPAGCSPALSLVVSTRRDTRGSAQPHQSHFSLRPADVNRAGAPNRCVEATDVSCDVARRWTLAPDGARPHQTAPELPLMRVARDVKES